MVALPGHIYSLCVHRCSFLFLGGGGGHTREVATGGTLSSSEWSWAIQGVILRRDGPARVQGCCKGAVKHGSGCKELQCQKAVTCAGGTVGGQAGSGKQGQDLAVVPDPSPWQSWAAWICAAV